MLRNLQPTEFDQYVDFAYDLALDLSQASFPIYNDGVKTKEYFIERSKKGMERDNEEILLYEEDGVVKGWIHYNFIEEDAYIGANNILVQSFWFYNRLGSLYRHHRRKAEMHKMV